MNSSCIEPAFIEQVGGSSQLYRIPGVYTGCSTIEAMFASTLQVFYDKMFVATLNIPSDISMHILNLSEKSRYTPTTPLNLIVQQLFIEDWNANKSFEQYYTGCQPSSCSYIVQIHREPIEVVTALLGIIGGLTTVLKFVISGVMEGRDALIEKCQKKKETSAATTFDNNSADKNGRKYNIDNRLNLTNLNSELH
ncbi:unnamed protein product [Rotaria sp. Silwood1]|nr:unnamed protein product [Rotaria sp. Silwood1]CAF1644419.1 unnamed protein product [Rotaria sp. Silwood1]CAF3806425.1 unnamed protein product [Rotaria sp. Silwood1]CAF3962526.1 unnamed protein product [Rotaria sp. Silwood1]CAF5016868.1 unnamed protein product [Rotaria sp. Silwood1]